MNLQQLAARQLYDFDRYHPGSCFAEAAFSLSTAEAYALQFQVAMLREQRGEEVAGYKIGCISRTMQSQLGLDRPIYGHLWQSETYASGSTLTMARFDGLAIEGEFAVRLADDVPSAHWLRHNPDVVASAFVVLELHNYVFRGSPTLRAAELIANNAVHAGVVLPVGETPLENAADLSTATLRVLRNGDLLGAAAGDELQGGPLAGITALVEHLAQYGRRLRRGQIVLTGSPLPLWPVAAGELLTVECDSFGKLATALINE